MDWHTRLADVAPGYRLVRLLLWWVLYDPEGNKIGQFHHSEEALRHAVAHKKRAEGTEQ